MTDNEEQDAQDGVNDEYVNGPNRGHARAIREAQKRLSWIENVKRIQGLSQEEAEKKWAEIFNHPQP